MKKKHHMSHKNSISYDDFGETFGKSRRDLHWDEIDEMLSQFLMDFSSTTGNVADIGCGNGRLLKHIQKHKNASTFTSIFSTYIGLDSSLVLLDQARADTSLLDFFVTTYWREGDMRDINSELWEYGLFDGIFFIASFHHLVTREDRISVLQQSKKLLSKTGKIVMLNWHLLHPTQVKYESQKISDYADGSADFEIKIGTYKRFYHAFSHEEYLSLAQEAWLVFSDSFGERNSIVIFQ
jgi:tRNA (uracil-5-)-methyltransferase TRM9